MRLFPPCGISSSAGGLVMTEAGGTFTCEASPLTVGRAYISRYLPASEAPRWCLDRAEVGGREATELFKGPPSCLQGPERSKRFSLLGWRCIPNTLRYSLFLLQLSEEHNDPVPASHVGTPSLFAVQSIQSAQVPVLCQQPFLDASAVSVEKRIVRKFGLLWIRPATVAAGVTVVTTKPRFWPHLFLEFLKRVSSSFRLVCWRPSGLPEDLGTTVSKCTTPTFISSRSCPAVQRWGAPCILSLTEVFYVASNWVWGIWKHKAVDMSALTRRLCSWMNLSSFVSAVDDLAHICLVFISLAFVLSCPPFFFNRAILLFLPQRCLQVLFSVGSRDMELRWLWWGHNHCMRHIQWVEVALNCDEKPIVAKYRNNINVEGLCPALERGSVNSFSLSLTSDMANGVIKQTSSV